MATIRKWKKTFLPLLWLAGFKIVSSSCCVVHCAAALDRFPYPQSFNWLAALTLHEKQARLMRPLAEWEFGWRCIAGALALWEMCAAGWDSLWTQRLAQCLTMNCYRCNGSPVYATSTTRTEAPVGCIYSALGVNKEGKKTEFRRRTDTWSELRELVRKMTPWGGEKEKQRKQERRQKVRQNALKHRDRMPLECSRTTRDPNVTKNQQEGEVRKDETLSQASDTELLSLIYFIT